VQCSLRRVLLVEYHCDAELAAGGTRPCLACESSDRGKALATDQNRMESVLQELFCLRLLAVLCSVALPLAAGMSSRKRAKDRRLEAARSIFESSKTTVLDFAKALDSLVSSKDVIERVDIDRPDVDNFSAVLCRVFLRRQKQSWATSLWIRLRYCMFGVRGLHAGEYLHVVLVGRRFSPKLSHMVPKPEKTFELELWDKGPDAPPRLLQIPLKELRNHLVEADWESAVHDPVSEELKMGLDAAHLRAFLTAAGVHPWEYTIYDGGVAAKAGLSCHVHSYDFEFLEDDTARTFKLRDPSAIKDIIEWYRSLSPSERVAYFERKATAPSRQARSLEPLAEFTRRCESAPLAPIALYVGSPMTAMATTFLPDKRGGAVDAALEKPARGCSITPEETLADRKLRLAQRVVLVSAMSGSWHGDLNLLGTNFNVAVDYSSAQKIMASAHVFPNCRFIIVPTETCKSGPFTLEAAEILKLPCAASMTRSREVISSAVHQWANMRTPPAAQPLFDVLTTIPLNHMVQHGQLVRAHATFTPTPKTKYGMLLEKSKLDGDSEETNGVLSLASPFPAGVMYALEGDVKDSMADYFQSFLGEMLQLGDVQLLR